MPSMLPIRDPDTGMMTMVPAGQFGLPSGALWDRLTGVARPDGELSAGTRDEAIDMIALHVFGSGDVQHAVETALECMPGDPDDEAETQRYTAILQGFADIAVRANADQAATWTGDTDNDRLKRAFAELDASGIIARENVGWSLADNEDEMDEIVNALLAQGVTVRGNVSYHLQDLEKAVVGHGLMLVYTGDRTGSEAARMIGTEIMAVLERHGLSPEWDGDPDVRIALPMVWRRRP